MADLNLLLPKPSWARVQQEVQAIPGVRAVLFDSNGIVVDANNEQVDAPIHLAWQNFEIPRNLYRAHAEMLLASKTLRFVQTAAAGLDAPVFQKLVEQGVTLCNSDAQALSIAEYVLASLLNAFHDFSGRKAQQVQRDWQLRPFQELAGSHCLVVGYGNIGKRIVDRLLAFEARVSVLRRQSENIPGVWHVGTVNDFERLLPDVDIIILACAINDETRHLINERSLKACQEGTVLINIARGALIDEAALLAAVQSGKIGQAVLDVFKSEPLPADHPFWREERILVTAHTSNSGSGRQARGDRLFLNNLRAYLEGKPLKNLVGEDFFAR